MAATVCLLEFGVLRALNDKGEVQIGRCRNISRM
jgi:hypothetical protein